jgi:hypothetical protein
MYVSHAPVHLADPLRWILLVLLGLMALTAVLGCASAAGYDVFGILRGLWR